jgi:hypothetical protein
MAHGPVWFTLIFLLFSGLSAEAQWQSRRWLHVDYTYSDITYKEPGLMTETGRYAGIRGELGVNLLDYVAFSAGGSYMDGHMDYDGSTFDGTPIKVITNDYIRDTRLLAHVVYTPFVLSYGVAQRYWYNDMVISYRRRTRYDYQPLMLTYYQEGFYVRYEHALWGKGWNKSHMSDTGGGRQDVEFELGKGTGMGFEIGVLLPTPAFATHLFASYHKWTVKESNVQNDGVDSLVEPNNNTTTIQIGLGVAF